MKTCRAFAPATVANVAVGFDLMGFALEKIGDIVELSKNSAAGSVRITALVGDSAIPRDPKLNTATVGILALLKDTRADFGLDVNIVKGIPIGSGLGGSAASAVAGVFGANAFLKKKLSAAELFHYAMLGEKLASGSSHPDNIAPCLLGGFIYTHSMDPFEYYKIDLPRDLFAVVVHQNVRVDTKHARGILKADLPLKAFVDQNRMLTGFLIGAFKKDVKLLGRSLQDLVIEPQRSKLIPHFDQIKSSALGSGALACSISGSGPSVFALVQGKTKAARVLKAMMAAVNSKDARGLISPISRKGARLL